VTTLPIEKLVGSQEEINYEDDFFGRK